MSGQQLREQALEDEDRARARLRASTAEMDDNAFAVLLREFAALNGSTLPTMAFLMLEAARRLDQGGQHG